MCGKQTTDGDTAQVGAEIAGFLGLPNVANVVSVDDVADGKLYVTASLDDRLVKLSVKMLCLISADGDINSPRLPSYKVKQSITDDMVSFLSFDDFDDKNPDNYGLAGSATQVERIFPPEKNTDKCVIDGSADNQAGSIFELVRRIKLI